MSIVHNKPNPYTWTIGIAQWILEDGNYNYFEVGNNYQFAVEFYLKDFEIVTGDPSFVPSVSKLDDHPNAYSVVAPLVYKDDEIYMLNLGGITAFDECPPNDSPPKYSARAARISALKIGDIIQADLYLNIDHYLYFETQCFREGVPSIIYTWHIDSIEKMTAELMHDPTLPYPNLMHVDSSTVQWSQTNKVLVSPGPRSYCEHMLHCTMQPVSQVGREHNIPPE